MIMEGSSQAFRRAVVQVFCGGGGTGPGATSRTPATFARILNSSSFAAAKAQTARVAKVEGAELRVRTIDRLSSRTGIRRKNRSMANEIDEDRAQVPDKHRRTDS